jgi:hypothetical protein
MINSGFLIFLCAAVAGISYLVGLSRASNDLKATWATFNELKRYTSELEEENNDLRAACDESPWGPMRNPSPARSSHLSVVK